MLSAAISITKRNDKIFKEKYFIRLKRRVINVNQWLSDSVLNLHSKHLLRFCRIFTCKAPGEILK